MDIAPTAVGALHRHVSARCPLRHVAESARRRARTRSAGCASDGSEWLQSATHDLDA
jgi:hypothetical protein